MKYRLWAAMLVLPLTLGVLFYVVRWETERELGRLGEMSCL